MFDERHTPFVVFERAIKNFATLDMLDDVIKQLPLFADKDETIEESDRLDKKIDALQY